jgi:hypothetical protein
MFSFHLAPNLLTLRCRAVRGLVKAAKLKTFSFTSNISTPLLEVLNLYRRVLRRIDRPARSPHLQHIVFTH